MFQIATKCSKFSALKEIAGAKKEGKRPKVGLRVGSCGIRNVVKLAATEIEGLGLRAVDALSAGDRRFERRTVLQFVHDGPRKSLHAGISKWRGQFEQEWNRFLSRECRFISKRCSGRRVGCERRRRGSRRLRNQLWDRGIRSSNKYQSGSNHGSGCAAALFQVS